MSDKDSIQLRFPVPNNSGYIITGPVRHPYFVSKVRKPSWYSGGGNLPVIITHRSWGGCRNRGDAVHHPTVQYPRIFVPPENIGLAVPVEIPYAFNLPVQVTHSPR